MNYPMPYAVSGEIDKSREMSYFFIFMHIEAAFRPTGH